MLNIIEEWNQLAAQNEGGDEGVDEYGQPRKLSYPQVGGFDPAQAVVSGAGPAVATQAAPTQATGAAGNMVTGGQGVGTQYAGAAPGQEEQAPDQRGGGTWSAQGLVEPFTQEDFYANTGFMVGQYSTGNEYVATPGRLPMGAISKAATILNNRQVELDQKRQAMMDELYKPIKTATPYQQNFNQIVNAEHDKFIKSVADAYTGGNIAKANRLIMSNPELRARWRQQNADLESLGARGEYVFNKAVSYLSDAATLKIASNPETRQLANDIIYGMGGYGTKDGKGGDFNTLISKINQFENLMGRDTYFKEKVVPSVKDFVRSTTDKPTYDTNRGLWIMSESTKKEWDSQKDAIAREMTTTGFGSYAENYEFLDKMLPTSVETKTTVRDIPRATGGGGDGDAKPQPSVTASVRKQEYIGPMTSQGPRIAFTPNEVVGGRSVAVTTYPLAKTGLTGKLETGYPELTWDENTGKWNIIARRLSEKDSDELVRIETDLEEKTIDEKKAIEDKRKIQNRIEKSPTEVFSVNENMDFLQAKYNSQDVYQIASNALAARGINVPASELSQNWSSKEYRSRVIAALEGGQMAFEQPSGGLTGGWSPTTDQAAAAGQGASNVVNWSDM